MAEKTVEQLMAENAVLKSFVAKAYNKSETEIDGLITDETGVRDDGFENLLTLDTSKTKRLKGDSQTMFDKGYQKAEAEVKSRVEKAFKEKTGFNDDADSFEELLDKYVEQAKTPAKTALTDDDVKRHPAYLALEKERIPKAEYEKVKTEFDEFKNGITKKQKREYLRNKIQKIKDGLNLEQIENEVVRAKRNELFLNDFDNLDYEQDGENIVLISDGKRLEDEHGNLITLNKYVEKKASEHYIVLKQSPKSSAGNGNPDVKVEPKGEVSIKDEAHYAELMAELDSRQQKETDPAKVIEIRKERAKLGETWMSQNKK
jgi:hypothetical protein